jgi:ElaB/YqjD/DUF883 family membrane-anchored ribosome-binding protein
VADTTTGTRKQAKETASTAVEQGKEVSRATREAAGGVVQATREQVSNVTSEVQAQARQLVGETRAQLRHQADGQTTRFADALRNFGNELQALCNGQPDQAGTARRYVERAGTTLGDAASRLQQRNFEGLVEDLQGFARRRPGTFLAVVAAAGFAVGRLARSVQDGDSQPTRTEGGGPHNEPPSSGGAASRPASSEAIPG